MKKIILTSLISLSAWTAMGVSSLAIADTADYRPEYAFYLGTGVGFDLNNTSTFEDSALKFKHPNKHYVVPEVFVGYNMDLSSGVELNFTDNNYTNSKALSPTTNFVVESNGYTGLLQFIGNYPLTYDQKLNAYGLLGIGATYWRTALNSEDTTNHLNVSGAIGIGLSYKLLDEVVVSTGYKFSYLGKVYEKDDLSSKRIMRHQIELRLKFNI